VTLTLHVPEIFQQNLIESPASFVRSTNDEREAVSILVAPSQQRRLHGAEKPYVSAVAFLSRHPKGANYLSVNLAEMKALSQELAGLFGLSLSEASPQKPKRPLGTDLLCVTPPSRK